MNFTKNFSKDGNGLLEIDEFIRFIAASKGEKMDIDEQVDRMFSLFDKVCSSVRFLANMRKG